MIRSLMIGITMTIAPITLCASDRGIFGVADSAEAVADGMRAFNDFCSGIAAARDGIKAAMDDLEKLDKTMLREANKRLKRKGWQISNAPRKHPVYLMNREYAEFVGLCYYVLPRVTERVAEELKVNVTAIELRIEHLMDLDPKAELGPDERKSLKQAEARFRRDLAPELKSSDRIERSRAEDSLVARLSDKRTSILRMRAMEAMFDKWVAIFIEKGVSREDLSRVGAPAFERAAKEFTGTIRSVTQEGFLADAWRDKLLESLRKRGWRVDLIDPYEDLYGKNRIAFLTSSPCFLLRTLNKASARLGVKRWDRECRRFERLAVADKSSGEEPRSHSQVMREYSEFLKHKGINRGKSLDAIRTAMKELEAEIRTACKEAGPYPRDTPGQ